MDLGTFTKGFGRCPIAGPLYRLRYVQKSFNDKEIVGVKGRISVSKRPGIVSRCRLNIVKGYDEV